MRISKIKDALELTRCLTGKKAVNFLKLRQSYRKSRQAQASQHRGLPLAFSIEPTTACNLGCPECPSGLRSFSRPTGSIKQSTFRTLIDQLEDHLVYLTLYFQGEPFIHKACADMISYASRKNIYTITSTNGHFLHPKLCEDIISSGLSRLIVSVDGAEQSSYEAYRKNGHLETVLQGIRNLVAAKKRKKSRTPYIIMQTIAFSSNEHELKAIRDLSQELGVDEWSLKTAQVYQEGKESINRIPKNSRLSRYEKKTDHYQIKGEQEDSCWRMWHSAVMTWDGTIVPCCFDKDAKYRLGNIHDAPFEEIWHGLGYKKMRNAILENRQSIDICRNCTEGCEVWLKPSRLI